MEKGLEKGREEGLKEGLEEGLEKGRAEEKRTIVRNLKSLSLPIESIMKATGLSAEEIESI